MAASELHQIFVQTCGKAVDCPSFDFLKIGLDLNLPLIHRNIKILLELMLKIKISNMI